MNENGGCLLRIREALHALTPKEQHLANFLLLQPERAVDMSIDELADICGVSISTVIRLCKSLGYSGYKELCRNLYSDLTAPAQPESSFEDIHPGDRPEVVMRNIFMSSIKAIENTFAIMDVSALEAAVDKLCAARRIDFYGLGASGFVALDASNKFQRCDKLAIAHMDTHSQLLSALTLRPEDVAVLISYSGDTTDMLNLARQSSGLCPGKSGTFHAAWKPVPSGMGISLSLRTVSVCTRPPSLSSNARVTVNACGKVRYGCCASARKVNAASPSRENGAVLSRPWMW